jgi:DNA-binding IclR family transcriptional regulator
MIKVLAKTDRILRVIAERPGLSFTELQQAMDLHKATLSNILKTLTELGYTARDADGGCHLGPAILELGSGERLRRALPKAAEESARMVVDQLRETVTVGKLLGGDRFNLAKVTVDRTISVNAKVELRPSPYSTATGRALLAFCKPADLEQTIAKHGLPGDAWDGIDRRKPLDKALQEIRQVGYAELSRGAARSFAVPVRDDEGKLLASIGTSIPDFRFRPDDLEPTLAILRTAADHMVHAVELAQEDTES